MRPVLKFFHLEKNVGFGGELIAPYGSVGEERSTGDEEAGKGETWEDCVGIEREKEPTWISRKQQSSENDSVVIPVLLMPKQPAVLIICHRTEKSPQENLSLDWCGSVGWASSCKLKGLWLDSMRAHAWTVGQVPSCRACKRQPISFSPFLLSFPSL